MSGEADEVLRRRPLRGWWAVAAGLLVGFAFAVTDHMWRATASFSGSLLLAALLRWFAPPEVAGGLVVRRRAIDVLVLLVLAVGVAVSGFTLNLTARP
ncbi:MAG: DUF3017 domain-containing protein [Tetrasphaera sp.]|nr:DUF3017 domain-containing protein [Tetrasphaera sp.]